MSGKKLEVHHGVSYTWRPHTVEGTIRVLEDIRDISRVRDGDVLVVTKLAHIMDFAAVVVMEKAVAVIAKTGGALCHAAILMREIDKPCLVVETSVLNKLKDGAVVRIEVNNEYVDRSQSKDDQVAIEFMMAALTQELEEATRRPLKTRNASIYIDS